MLQRFKPMVARLLNNPNSRVVFILSMLLLAALIGGAPHDVGGG